MREVEERLHKLILSLGPSYLAKCQGKDSCILRAYLLLAVAGTLYLSVSRTALLGVFSECVTACLQYYYHLN